jgi:hypothetical protein
MHHIYKTGESVTLVTRKIYSRESLGVFQVVRLLPVEQGGAQYRIRSVADGHERVVVEGELAKWTGA